MEFTEDQSNAFEKIKDIDSWDIFILTGQAGSGKHNFFTRFKNIFKKINGKSTRVLSRGELQQYCEEEG